MAKILKSKSIYYNDCVLLPRVGVIKSRSEVPDEKWRIIVSPMEAVIGVTFVREAAKAGISVCLHRFQSFDNQILMLREFDLYKGDGNNFAIVSVGLSDLEKTKKELLYCKEIGVKEICLDIANGYLPQIKDFADLLKEIEYRPALFIGNVNTGEGVRYLYNLFEHIVPSVGVRLGIGGGSPCITSSTAGINRGNITEIIECAEVAEFLSSIHTSLNLIADGSLKDSSFVAKAFAAGANFVFMGGFFMNAKEAYSNLHLDGSYWGGASHKQLQRNGVDISTKHAEGKTIEKDKSKELLDLKDLVFNLWGGIRSYVSYSGYKSLSEAIGNGVFEVKENSLPPRRRE